MMKNKQKQLLLLFLLSGIGYYFAIYLPKKQALVKKSTKTPQQLQREINKKTREEAIANIEKLAQQEIIFSPLMEKDIQKFIKKISKSSEEDISLIEREAINFITKKKHKRQGLHWLREPNNWADKKLEILQQDFNNSWNQFCSIVNPYEKSENEPKKCVFGASYKIKFPPLLWNELNEAQKKHEKVEELKLRSEVDNYTFNPKIDNWYDKALIDPMRGDRDRSNFDNNATLYGAPRTGKSIIVEKLAYNADRYPLVVIQGSALTPTINDQKCGIDNFKKFIYAICDINNTLIDDFGIEINEESGEPPYIFFIDEANQVSENTFARKSSGLIFLKECMGSDDYKRNESHNLWIVATNHLSEIDEAVYQPGRLANQLNFSWTIGKFKEYATDAGIINDFPSHWENASLSEEDNKYLNRFNIIHFEESFLGRKINGASIDNAISFWNMFIKNEENKKILPEEKEEVIINEETGETEEVIKQKGIQLGEFLQFFWQKFDGGELWDREFDAKFVNPREPKMTETVINASNHISNTLDIRLKELNKSNDGVLSEMKASNSTFHENFNKHMEQLCTLLSEIKN